MSKIKGIEKREVEIEVGTSDLFRALCEELNMYRYFYFDKYDFINEIVDNGKIISLEIYTDMSWYGSYSDKLVESTSNIDTILLYEELKHIKEKLSV